METLKACKCCSLHLEVPVSASSIHTAILDLLKEQEDHHLTAVEIYEHISARLPAVNPSSVYRALDRLAAEGLVSVSDMGVGATVYEFVHQKRHHHLVCHACGKIILMNDDLVHDFFTHIEASSEYQITTNHLVLFGVCPECKARMEIDGN